MSLNVLKCGPLSTIQDLGRNGVQHLGVSQSGAADEYAFRWANKLLGNTQNTACIEITLGPFSVEFNLDTEISICGANANYLINNLPIKIWQNQRIKKGDILTINTAKNGLLIYLAVKGGFESIRYFNSQSFNPRESHLTPKLKQIKNGDIIHFKKINLSKKFRYIHLNESYIPDYKEPLELSLIPMQKLKDFSLSTHNHLFSSLYKISQDSNKMAYRLHGEALNYRDDYENTNISSAVTLGTIQVPDNGQPIILLKDRQTIGGYPIIGTIPTIDTFKLCQRRPGEEIFFKKSSVSTEEKRYKNFLNLYTT